MKILLENGHGGIINGVYQTAGKRSPKWKDGTQLFEGEFNRKVVEGLEELCIKHGVNHHVLVPELQDVPLSERVKRVNKIHKAEPCLLISVHANAGGGTGFEVFTSVGKTKSDGYAQTMIDVLEDELPLKLRKDTSDGDEDKEAHFYILKNTNCPAMLIECAFMDTYEPDCKLMIDKPEIFIDAIFKGIMAIVK